AAEAVPGSGRDDAAAARPGQALTAPVYALRVRAVDERFPRPSVMGVGNVTPDSFSDGGVTFRAEDAIASARQMVADGAAIVDVGGESTRPGAATVSPDEEPGRGLPGPEGIAGGV